MAQRFRDRFFTPRVARAITSPLGIVLAGGGMALGVVLGLPVAAAVGIGALAWAGRVAAAVPPGRTGPKIDAASLAQPWRSFVEDAQEATARYHRAVAGTKDGPLRDHLAEVGGRIDQGVDECWRIATRGQDIDAGLASIDTTSARNELAALRGSGGSSGDVARTMQSLEAQIASADRLARVSADARSRLRLLNARLDELVARAVELSFGTSSDLGSLDDDVEGLVAEMESLRLAVEETNRPGPTGQALPSA